MADITPRVRFAPSPTGYLHIGGLRTALYNYLFAKNRNGKIILRIEDTDRKRHVEGAVDNLLDTLRWVGLEFDEGPENDGGYGPYFQSERLDIYNECAEELINKSKAYYCFCSPQRLNELREEQQKQKLPQSMYDKHCLHLSEKEIKHNLESRNEKTIRLNVEPGKKIIFNDIIRDQVEFESSNVDDQVIIKSDGYPTYHLANVVDDHLMGITHVIRGEEWLSSTPKHILLYEYLGWEKPAFAHLPLLLNPDKSKLSKRQGDVAVEDYRDKGYLKEALINFVAFLGWNPGDESEFLSMDELIQKFSLERVHKAGAVFNLEKLTWLNEEHLRNKSSDELLKRLKEEISKSEYAEKHFENDYLLNVIEAMKPRVSFIKEFITTCTYFYSDPQDYDEDVIKKRWKENSPELLIKLRDKIALLKNPSTEDYESALNATAVEMNAGKGQLIHPVRLAVSGSGTGPGVYDLLFILGKDECIKRINKAIDTIKQ